MTHTAVQQFAGHYLNCGFAVVPLQPRQKKAYVEDWPTTTFRVADFSPTDNIGLRSINGLVVVDDDFPAAALGCDDAFLPKTTTWGRPSKPQSKRLYLCPELTGTITFTDIDNSHLYQLRVGLQDMAPPSIHPNTGERLQWSGLLLPCELTREQLVGLARYRWTAGLIAKYWPARGRHDLRLAYARVLLDQLEIPDEDAVRILEWACRLGGSDDHGVHDVINAIRSTRAALTDDKPAWGARKVAELLPERDTGRRIVSLLRKMYGKRSAVDEAIDKLNEKFAIVSVGNKVVVMETWPDGSIKMLWPFEEFKKLLVKEHIVTTTETPTGKTTLTTTPIANLWLSHHDGRRYDRLVYAMPGSTERCEPDDYNGWLGFTITPKPGDWSKNREHLRRIICGGNAEVFAWVLNWMAALVQWPGRHAFSALVLRGGQGTGKGHFAHLMLGALFHKQQYLHIIGAEMLTGRFNEHLSGKVLIFADESTWGGDPRAADKLKGIVTESTVPIERKFLALTEEPSALHIVVASNNEWPISIPMDDRRFQVMDVVEDERQNDAYFEPLRSELARGGLAAMLDDLLAHTVDDHALRHPLTTKGKREVMVQSLNSIQRWWYDKLVTGALLAATTARSDNATKKWAVPAAAWPTSIPKELLHDDYLAFLDKHRDTRTRRSTQTELGMFLKKYTPMREQRQLDGMDGEKTYIWQLPTLRACRVYWATTCKWPDDFDWDNQE